MKVLHVAFSFAPDPPGGTEIYVEELCRQLQALGVQGVVAAPGARDAAYDHRGLRVRRFGISGGQIDLEDLYGGGDAHAANAFERILDEERPDVLHQHALTSACSAQLIRLAKKRGIPVVFTYHTATVSCQRGTLLEWARKPCDGQVSVARCTPCTLHGLGLDQATSGLVGRTPEVAGQLIGLAGLGGGAWTALRMRNLMRRRTDHFVQLLTHVDAFVSLTPWVRELLHLNGVPDSRITDCSHGVFGTWSGSSAGGSASPAGRLRIAHLGRLEPGKGTRLLVEAVRSIPEVRLSLDIFGVVQNPADAERLSELQALAATDPRIRFLPPLAHADVVDTLAGYDLVAVPSQLVETGPLVVLEAFAAGVPVLGSSLGGIADKVAHGKNGWLVEPHASVDAWSAALSRCASEGQLLTRTRTAVRQARTMTDVAREMRSLYVTQLANADRTIGSRVRRVPVEVPSMIKRQPGGGMLR
jgi:glycosyltransferase involved in cell wall biosynthesis